MGLTVKQMETLRLALSQLPVVDDGEKAVSKRQAIAMLAVEIRDLQKKGYTYELIAQALSNNGLDLSVATLKSYIAKAKQTMKRSGGIRTRADAGKPADGAAKIKTLSPDGSNAPQQETPTIVATRSSRFTPRSDSADI